MDDNFDDYEQQYWELSIDLSQRCTTLSALSGNQKKEKLSELNAGLEEAESLIRKMDLKARSLKPSQKSALLAKLRDFKSDLNNLKKDAKKFAASNEHVSMDIPDGVELVQKAISCWKKSSRSPSSTLRGGPWKKHMADCAKSETLVDFTTPITITVSAGIKEYLKMTMCDSKIEDWMNNLKNAEKLEVGTKVGKSGTGRSDSELKHVVGSVWSSTKEGNHIIVVQTGPSTMTCVVGYTSRTQDIAEYNHVLQWIESTYERHYYKSFCDSQAKKAMPAKVKAMPSTGKVKETPITKENLVPAVEESIVYASKVEAKNAFIKLLEAAGIEANWTWEQAMPLIINDKRYGALKNLNQRKQTFQDFLTQKKRQETKERAANLKKAEDNFVTMLQESKKLSSKMQWSNVTSLLGDDPRFCAIKKDCDRQELFKVYAVELEGKENEERKKKDKMAMEQREKKEQKNISFFKKLMEKHRAVGILHAHVHWRQYRAIVKDHEAYRGVLSNSSGPTAKDLFEEEVKREVFSKGEERGASSSRTRARS